jgi:hypothetical protein
MTCKAIQQSDEMFCATCGLRWDVNDSEPPACATITLIGLTGATGSGKSTVAGFLHEFEGWSIVKFAAALKNGLGHMLRTVGMSESDINDAIEGDMKEVPLDALGGHTPRYAMQTLGTEWGRNHMGQDFWVNMVRARIGNAPAGSKIVIDDVRFENEAALIRELGGKVIMITGREGIVGEHVSEHGVVPDVTIKNDGDKLALMRNVMWEIDSV